MTDSLDLADLRRLVKCAVAAYATSEMLRREASNDRDRAEGLLALIDELDRASRDLLEKAALTHVTGALTTPQLAEHDSHVRHSEHDLAKSFASAQLAFADLHVGLFGLAQALARQGRWDDARRCLLALLTSGDSALKTDALSVLEVVITNTGHFDPFVQIGCDLHISRVNRNYPAGNKGDRVYQLLTWHVEVGSVVDEDQLLATFGCSGYSANFHLLAPSAGLIAYISKNPSEQARPGEVLGGILPLSKPMSPT